MPQLHALILAGGSGTRFWPWSRAAHPKQFLAIDGHASLLARTHERLEGWIAPENRWVLTRADLVETVAEELPTLDPAHILGEPEGRDTAPALALGALRVAAVDPDALLLILPSDHHIADPAAFRATVDRAVSALTADDGLYTFGVTPTEPATGYGYIERGDATGHPGCASVRAFREKPDRATAEAFLADGGYFWNAGIFLWRASTFLAELARASTEFAAGIESLGGVFERDDGPDALADAFRSLPKISIDFALLEKSDRVRVVEAAFPWDDVGTWEAVPRLRAEAADRDGNIVDRGVVTTDCRRAVVVRGDDVEASERVIVLHGVEDMLVVDTGDALLVCPRARAQEVRGVVETLRERGLERST